MRHLFTLFLLLTGAALSFTACSDDIDDTQVLNPEFSVDKPTLTFDWSGETQYVDVTFKDIVGSWSATTADEWITLADNSGSESGRFSVTVGENTTGTNQEGRITVKAPGQGDITILVEQPYDDSPLFKTDKESLEFTADGGSETLILTFANIEGTWIVRPVEDWISVDKIDGSETAEITVTVEPYEFTADRSFTMTISSEGFDNLEVEITQRGFVPPTEPTNIHEQSTQARLNFTKAVYKVSHLYDPLSKTELQNLVFDKNGMLRTFENMDVIGQSSFEITYDEENPYRIKTIYCNWYNDPDSQVEIEFEYGNHGKWIGTQELFFQLDNQAAGALWRVWAPRLIKNLEKITFVKSYNNETDGAVFQYVFTGNNGVLRYISPDAGVDPDDFQELTYEGDYPTKVEFEFSLMGMPADFVCPYDINASTGTFNTYMMNAELFGQVQPVYAYAYGNDRLNSRTAVYDMGNSYTAADYISEVAVEYDDKLNIVKIDTPTAYNFSYTYDEYGNWTKMEMSGGSVEETVERTIEYR